MNAHWRTFKKADVFPFVLKMAEENLKPIPSKGWAEMIRRIYGVDPMLCARNGGVTKVVALIREYDVVDRIIDRLKPRFIAEKPPPSRVSLEIALMEAERQSVSRRFDDFSPRS